MKPSFDRYSFLVYRLTRFYYSCLMWKQQLDNSETHYAVCSTHCTKHITLTDFWIEWEGIFAQLCILFRKRRDDPDGCALENCSRFQNGRPHQL